jgi:hypothetical protein
MIVFNKTHYIELAQSVLAGFPMEEAEKILVKQREVQGNNSQEPAFWLEIKKGEKSGSNTSDMTTIQVSKSTRDDLEELNKVFTDGPNTYDKVIGRLIIEREMRLSKNELIESAYWIVIHLDGCTDIEEHTKLIEELYCKIGKLIDVGHHLETRLIAAKALEYLEFGFKTMTEMVDSEGNCLYMNDSDRYDLYNEYFQKLGYLKDESFGYYNHCRE